ncbi:MAG: hypothetical protein C5B50_28115 [Verrucomicrobia bacterium]|nr:MAG: hypothetical protein C5B50_28115 [Verrucomicrobiota bacterium]
MNTKLITAALLLLATGSPSLASPRTEANVRKAVETWVRGVTADKRAAAVVEEMKPYSQNGTNAAYIVRLKGGGYCLAGADSLVLPVYWYSPKGAYDPKNPGCKFILHEIADRLSYVQALQAKGDLALKQQKAALDERAVQWDALAAGQTITTSATSSTLLTKSAPGMLVLPLTCQWGQDYPFNDYCPELPGWGPNGTPGSTLVGCVATAMAQVMDYWKWPNTGAGPPASVTYNYRGTSGTFSAPVPTDPGIPSFWAGKLSWSSGFLTMSGYWDASLLGYAMGITVDPTFQSALQSLYAELTAWSSIWAADFGATTYNWSQMLDQYSGDADPGALTAAKISFHAGVAVGMDYGLKGSGIPESAAGRISGALALHFRYDPSATWGILNINMLVNEIQWRRPVILVGDSGSVAHCWVVLGYNQRTSPWQFAMNMGWNGSANGWYSVDQVPLGLDYNQTETVQIAPFSAVGFVGSSSSGNGSPSSPYSNIEQALANAANGTTLIFKAGSYNTFSASQLVLNRPLTLKGMNATIGK